MQKIFSFFSCLLFLSLLHAQNTIPTFALGFTTPQVKGFTDDQNTLLRSKTLEAMSAAQVAVYDYHLNFYLQPDFAIVNKKVADGGLRKLFVVSANVLFFVKNQTNQQVISAKSINVQGSGTSEEEAVSNAINSIEPDASAIQDFLAQTREKMGNYYKSQCNVLSNEFELLLAKKNYEAVLVRLATIPSENKECLDRMKTIRTKALKMYEQQKAGSGVAKKEPPRKTAPADHKSIAKGSAIHGVENTPAKGKAEPAFANLSTGSGGDDYNGNDPVSSIASAILKAKQLTR